jgi:glycosyltransferase involved in cell wall biosynthesis
MTEQLPLVTTIIPTYNRCGLLANAIKCAQQQTFNNIVILVIDNASTDGTREIVEKLQQTDSRIKYIRNDTNIGPTLNFIKGIEATTTPYFSILSDDDEITPRFYDQAVPVLEADKELMFFAGQTTELRNGKLVKTIPGSKFEQKHSPASGFSFLVKEHITWTAIVFRKAVMTEIKLFDIHCFYFVENDIEFSVASKFPFYYKPTVVAIFNLFADYAHHNDTPLIWNSLVAVYAKQCSENQKFLNALQLFKWFKKRFPTHCPYIKTGDSLNSKYAITKNDLIKYFNIYNSLKGIRFITYLYIYFFYFRQAVYYKLRLKHA